MSLQLVSDLSNEIETIVDVDENLRFKQATWGSSWTSSTLIRQWRAWTSAKPAREMTLTQPIQ